MYDGVLEVADVVYHHFESVFPVYKKGDPVYYDGSKRVIEKRYKPTTALHTSTYDLGYEQDNDETNDMTYETDEVYLKAINVRELFWASDLTFHQVIAPVYDAEKVEKDSDTSNPSDPDDSNWSSTDGTN